MHISTWSTINVHIPAGVSGKNITITLSTEMMVRTDRKVAFFPIFSETGTVTMTPTSWAISPAVRKAANVNTALTPNTSAK